MDTRIAFSLLFLRLGGWGVSFGAQGADRPILHLRDFAENQSLTAHARQMVILDSQRDPADAPIRYELETGKHEFCLQGRDPYFTGLVLEDETGNTIFTLPGYKRCITATLSKGIYTLHISRSSEGLPNPKQFARVQLDFPSAPLVDANGNPAGGYWAIAPNDSGRLTAQLPVRNLGSPYSSAMPLVAD